MIHRYVDRKLAEKLSQDPQSVTDAEVAEF